MDVILLYEAHKEGPKEATSPDISTCVKRPFTKDQEDQQFPIGILSQPSHLWGTVAAFEYFWVFGEPRARPRLESPSQLGGCERSHVLPGFSHPRLTEDPG